VDGRTTVSSESVCPFACNWVDVGSFHTLLFGVMYVTCADFHDGSEKRPGSHLRPHPAVAGEIRNGCHPPPTVLP
jgi:hypothetical protein